MDKKKQVERLLKFMALADGGEGGEAINAKKMLDKLMKKYDITIDELNGTESQTEAFYYGKGRKKKDLMFQVIASVIGDNEPTYSNPFYKLCIIAKVDKGQKIEIELKFNAYKVAMEKSLKQSENDCYHAFVQKNDIFYPCPKPEKECSKNNTLDPAAKRRLINAMESIEKTNVFKEIQCQK